MSVLCSARPLTVYKVFFFLLFSGVQKKNPQHKRVKPWECLKRKGQMLPIFKCNNWLHRMKIYRATLTNSGIEQCCLVVWPLFRVDVDFMDCLKFCWLNRFFFLYIKKRKEKSSLCCTHTKKWISSQEGQGSRVPTPRHFNVHFYDDLKKKKEKCKGNHSKHWKLWISEEEKIPFVSKSVAVT